MNITAHQVVACESTDAAPRGPNAVWLPAPPKAPARSAALPLCSSTTIMRTRQFRTKNGLRIHAPPQEKRKPIVMIPKPMSNAMAHFIQTGMLLPLRYQKLSAPGPQSQAKAPLSYRPNPPPPYKKVTTHAKD